MISVLYYYLTWHYSTGLRDLVRNVLNVAWFFYHFFSISILLQTFFSPFQRLSESRGKGLDIERFAETLIVNTLMRAVGIFVRTIFIVAGVVAITITAVGGTVLFFVWLAAPLFVITLIGSGFVFFFT